ncbi:hypothetical protein ACJIZ3_019433 [Penstemon smallii]|uniref:C2H2-type domain-containing protein n=1 Tax=Penstemon smallii TaxID=265156 RepID=A0ABD3T153_9LAMI
MMDEDQELKFVCKFCYKKFPCGKALGGHIRSHVVSNSAEFEEKVAANLKRNLSFGGYGGGGGGAPPPASFFKESKLGEFGNGQTSYVLRENPRKTWRAVDSNLPLPQERFCKQCGKGFQSLKALCGHMACHSEKDRGLKDDHSWTSENQKLVLDSCSDTEEAEERRLRTRSSSKSNKYKKVMVKSPTNNNGGSSSVSEIDGLDQEEVARCLIMLSKDSGNRGGGGGGVNSVVESSDNNSVVLETKSSSIDMRIGKMGSLNFLCNEEGTPKVKKIEDMKLKGRPFDDEIAQVENSDSGYFLDECGKAESDVSVDGFRKNLAFFESKKPLMSVKGKAKEYGFETKKGLIKIKNFKTEYDDSGTASNFAGIESRKRKHSSENPELWNEVCNNNAEKRSKYECFNCKRSFKSYQALGGHRPCHKRTNSFYDSKYESGENSLDNDDDDPIDFRTKGNVLQSTSKSKSKAKVSSDKKTKGKKNKEHICPFCDRVFKNGQALGGHKRSHFIGGHVETSNHHPQMKPELPDLLDLNLPAPEEDEEEDDGGAQFFPW